MKKDTLNNKLVDYRSFFWSPDHIDISAWIEHIPFAFWIIEVLKPKSFVELGVHNGTSYFAFCQALKTLNLNAVSYGVDTWKGDEHAGFYGDEVFGKVSDHNTRQFSRFSTLIRSTFDEAKNYFIDGSIDLLHIDGLHTYESVKHDFEAWLPKISGQGLVILHDINVRERNFGVFKLWEEIKQIYPSFQFDFGHGLGIVAIGEIVGEELRELFNKEKSEGYFAFLTNYFSERGHFFKTSYNNDLALKALHSANTALGENYRISESLNGQLNEKYNTLESLNGQLNESHKTLEEHTARLTESHKILEVTNNQLQTNLNTTESANRLLQTNLKDLTGNYERLKEQYKILESTNIQFQEKSKNEIADLLKKFRDIESSLNNTSHELTATKKENEAFKNYLAWYKATYEDRSILGVLKEKIKAGGKKKIKSEISGNGSSLTAIQDKDSTEVADVKSIKGEEEIDGQISADELQRQEETVQFSIAGTLNVRYRADTSNLSDVCIFSSFSFSGKVEEYVFYYLAELRKAGFSIVFVSTSQLTDSCVNRLSQYAFLIIERENKCPDFGSWKAGLSMLDWGKELNSVLLANDSVFGPFFDLGAIISSMKKRFDIWGMTDSYEIGYHLQSYFLYFNKAALHSNVFTGFWKNVDLSASKDEVIHKYEIGLSSLFAGTNLKLGAYASIDVLTRTATHVHTVINPTLVFWKSLIKTHKFPFLKRELNIKMHISKTYWNLGLYINIGNWKRTIEENTAYPVNYIVDFITNYHKIIKGRNTSIVLRKRKILFLSENAEIGEPQRVLINFLQWLNNETDLIAEIIICKPGNDELRTEFERLGMVTNFYSLSESEKISLKERLVDEIGLVFSSTVQGLNVQQFLSFLDVPQIIYVHTLTSAIREHLLVRNTLTWIRKNVTQFIADTETIRRDIIQYLEVDPGKVEMVHKFIHPYTVDEFAKKPNKIKSDLGIPDDAFIVGMCGKLDWNNSADLLPVIAAHLCRDNNNIHIIWAGADTDSPLYQSIQFGLGRAGLAERVHLPEKKMDTRNFFAVFDVFVTCSRDESFPLEGLESALSGIPVICFQDPKGSSEYTDMGMGHSVPYLDITALTERVLVYYNNRSQLGIEKALLPKIVKDNFTTATQAPKLLQIINTHYDHDEMMFVEEPSLTFLTHIYYENSWEEIRNKLKNFDNGKNYFLFSISEACLVKEQIIEDIRRTFKNTFFLITSNIGKDIGGKMALIDLYLLFEIKSSYIVFLHDKQSPHSIAGETWKNNLFKILDPNNQKFILDLFKDAKTGIVGAKDHIVNEYNSVTDSFRNNNQLSKKLLTQFGITIENYDFLGGSIYWIRSSIIENFFTKNHPILMRENLEAGNVIDLHEERLAHTWERMFSWIAANDGYTIKGI